MTVLVFLSSSFAQLDGRYDTLSTLRHLSRWNSWYLSSLIRSGYPYLQKNLNETSETSSSEQFEVRAPIFSTQIIISNEDRQRRTSDHSWSDVRGRPNYQQLKKQQPDRERSTFANVEKHIPIGQPFHTTIHSELRRPWMRNHSTSVWIGTEGPCSLPSAGHRLERLKGGRCARDSGREHTGIDS